MTVQCCIRRYRTANDYWTIQDYSGLYGPVRDSKGPYVTIFYFLYCYEIEKNLGEIVQIGKIDTFLLGKITQLCTHFQFFLLLAYLGFDTIKINLVIVMNGAQNISKEICDR